MLKGIPEILSPELLKVLCEMGHSDRLVIADGNFPVESMGKNAITIRCDGHGVPEILEAILKVFPLDTYVEHPVNLMEVMPGDDVETPIWDTYKEIIRKYDDRGDAVVGNIERFAFYDEAKTAYCIISTNNHRPSFFLSYPGDFRIFRVFLCQLSVFIRLLLFSYVL